MKICFITIGDMNWASSRMRSYWPIRYLPEGSMAIQWSGAGEDIPTDGYDAFIWMKTGDVDIMRKQRQSGAQVIVEVCDPNWWFMPNEMRELTDICTCVVAASEPAQADFLRWYGDKQIYIVPDRIELDVFPIRKERHEPADPVKMIWYGMSNNRVALFGAFANLERLTANGVNLTLTICDNEPNSSLRVTDAFPIYYVEWSLKHENSIIAEHDIALLPPYPGPWGRLKTNNKTLTAWACGLPVTDGQEYYTLRTLATDEAARQINAAAGWKNLNRNYLTEHTAAQWLEIIETEKRRLND